VMLLLLPVIGLSWYAMREPNLLMQSMAAVFIGLALLGLLVFVFRLRRSIRARQSRVGRADEENRRNQAAILRLMEELAVIADGNLTAQASVTEEITGAVADS